MKFKYPIALLIVAGLSLAGTAQAADNLVANNSFEDFSISDEDGTLSGLGAWSFSPTGAFDLMAAGLPGLSAHDGGSNLVFNYSSSISQTLTGLTAGNQYLLSFAYATGDTTSLGDLSVSLGGMNIFSSASVSSAAWTVVSPITWAATGNSAELSFSGGNGVGLDTISVTAITAVPEPTTYAMLLAGLGMLGAIARRRARL